MADILLIQPPIRDFYLTAKRTLPYGLACIAATLIDKGFSVQILDGLATPKSKRLSLPPEMAYLKDIYGQSDLSPFALFHHYRHFGYSFEHIGKAARDSGAFLIGISSLFSAYSDEALKTAETVKAFHPEGIVVLGGHHPSVFPEKVLECPAVDFVLSGEGEDSLPLLANALKTGAACDKIPGIAYRNGGGLRINPPALKVDLSSAPLPALHLLQHRFYSRAGRASAVITASRGCPLQCSYCCLGASSKVVYRRRSVTSVVREIEHAVNRHDAGFIDFEDENLSLDKTWFLRLLAEIRKRFGGCRLELRAMNGLLPLSLDDEIVCAMQASGFKVLNLSLGSTNPQQLKRFGRPDVRNAFEVALRLAEKYDLGAVGYIIAGAPQQSAEASLNDLLYLACRRVLAGISIFYPAPGSADYHLCERLEILPAHFSLLRSSCLPLSHTTDRLQAATLLRLGRILNFMKALVERGLPIPEAQPFSEKADLNLHDRLAAGIQLLSWFLADAKIRGITPAGHIFEHRSSRELTCRFIDGLATLNIRGSGIPKGS